MNFPPVSGLGGPMIDPSTQRVYYVDLRTQQSIPGEVVVQRLIAMGQMQPPPPQYGQPAPGVPMMVPQYARPAPSPYMPPPIPQYQQPGYGQQVNPVGMNMPLQPPPLNLAAEAAPPQQPTVAPAMPYINTGWMVSLLKPPRCVLSYPVDIYAPIEIESEGKTKTVLFKRDYLEGVMNKNQHLQILPEVTIQPEVEVQKVLTTPQPPTFHPLPVEIIEEDAGIIDNLHCMVTLAQSYSENKTITVIRGEYGNPASVLNKADEELTSTLLASGHKKWFAEYMNIASGYRDRLAKVYPRLTAAIEDRMTEIANDVLACCLRVTARVTDSLYVDYADMMKYLYSKKLADDFNQAFDRLLRDRAVMYKGALVTTGTDEDGGTTSTTSDVAIVNEIATMAYIPAPIEKMSPGVLPHCALSEHINVAINGIAAFGLDVSYLLVASESAQIYRVLWTNTPVRGCRVISIAAVL